MCGVGGGQSGLTGSAGETFRGITVFCLRFQCLPEHGLLGANVNVSRLPAKARVGCALSIYIYTHSVSVVPLHRPSQENF